MATTRVVVIGAGGHGREVFSWVRDCSRDLGLEFVGFLDDGAPAAERLARLKAAHLGGLEALVAMSGVVHYVGIGDPVVRREVADRARGAGSVAGPPLVHPGAHVGPDVLVGEGSVIAPGVVLTTNVRVGRHVYLGANVVIGHDTEIDDFVSVYPGATISGEVRVGAAALIGTNATIIQGLRVGAGATLGAGGAAVRDISAGVTTVGVPARPR